MNPEFSGLCYVQTSSQKFKFYWFKQLALFLKCLFLSIIAIIFDQFKKIKDLHYSGVCDLLADQILSLLVFNKSNYISFYKMLILWCSFWLDWICILYDIHYIISLCEAHLERWFYLVFFNCKELSLVNSQGHFYYMPHIQVLQFLWRKY